MNFISTRVSYRYTGAFSKLTNDYLDQAPELRPFYRFPSDMGGTRQAIAARQQQDIDRQLLVTGLRNQYGKLLAGRVAENIGLLQKPTTFTVTTAHQPNLLTGPLYFIYKILHTVRLAEKMKQAMPEFDFVPVYYMGCEDADLDELGHLYLDGRKIDWKTAQKGAVGRMKVDESFLQLLSDVKGQIAIFPKGQEIMERITGFFSKGARIQDATFELVDHLFSEFGLVVFIPDNPTFKARFTDIFEDELLEQRSSELVRPVINQIEKAGYKVQAHPREINLFYLLDGLRERIVAQGEGFQVVNTDFHFSRQEIIEELKQHPERFSPNVILRGLFQAKLLPDICFVGGGGELAYWLQYGQLFSHYSAPFPVLVLRNSFLIVDENRQEAIRKTGFSVEDFFRPEAQLMELIVNKNSSNSVKINEPLAAFEKLYEECRQQAAKIDATLSKHVEALKTKAVYRLLELEKKMLRAEKRKFGDQQRQIEKIRSRLFPGNGLQERVENMLTFYSHWGQEFLRELYRQSLAFEQEFVLLSQNK